MSEVWPPRSWEDIAAYSDDDIVAGYREWRPDDVEPGDNHSPGYRWGWTNAAHDHGREDDFSPLRFQYIAATRARH